MIVRRLFRKEWMIGGWGRWIDLRGSSIGGEKGLVFRYVMKVDLKYLLRDGM